MRRKPRLDANHHAIEDALHQAGASTRSLAGLGDGAPDLLVYSRGRLWLMEIKTRTGRVTRAQAVWHEVWPVHIVRSPDEALALIGVSGLKRALMAPSTGRFSTKRA